MSNPSIAGSSGSSPDGDKDNTKTSISSIRDRLFGCLLNPLSVPPKLTKIEEFNDWKESWIQWSKINHVNKLFLLPPKESWQQCLAMDLNRSSSQELLRINYVERHIEVANYMSQSVKPFIKLSEIVRGANKDMLPSFEWPSGLTALDAEDNAYVVWNYLIKNYDKRPGAGAISYLIELFNLKFRRGDNPVTYVQKFLEINREIEKLIPRTPADAGKHFNEELSINFLCLGLPDEMQHFKDTVVSTKGMTVEMFQQKLRDIEAQAKVSTGNGLESMNAFSSNPTQSTQGRGKKDKKKKNKGNYGNKVEYQAKMEQNTTSDNKNANKGPFKPGPTGSINGSPMFFFHEGTMEEENMLAMGEFKEGSNAERARVRVILDSACTQHVVYDKSLLLQLKEGAHIFMSEPGGQINKVTHYGSLPVCKDLFLSNVALVPRLRVNLLSMNKLVMSGFLPKYSEDRLTCTMTPPGNNISSIVFKYENGLYVKYMDHMFKRAGNSDRPFVSTVGKNGTLKKIGHSDRTGTGNYETRSKTALVNRLKALKDIVTKRKAQSTDNKEHMNLFEELSSILDESDISDTDEEFDA